MPDINPIDTWEESLRVDQRLALVESYRSEWMVFIRSAMASNEIAIATIAFEAMNSRDEPDDHVVRSLREISMYYARPALMDSLTRNRVESDIRLVEASIYEDLVDAVMETR